MRVRDRKRLYIIRQTEEGKISQKEAAEILELTDRQIRRLIRRVQQGDKGVLHRGRGKGSNNKIAGKIKEKVLDLCVRRYSGFGPTLISEKLIEDEQIAISDETVRRWLLETGLEYRKRKSRRHRSGDRGGSVLARCCRWMVLTTIGWRGVGRGWY